VARALATRRRDLEYRAVDPDRIAPFPLFADLDDAQLTALASAMQERDVEAGERLIVQGDFGYTLLLIEQGEADVVLDGTDEVARSLGPGDACGEIALLVTGRRTASVVARTPMKLLALFEQDFRRACVRLPELEPALRPIAGERLTR
jgi:CRP-like cAMP-binding protein